MNIRKIKRGYNLPLSGAPDRNLDKAPSPKSFGLHPTEFPDIKPKLSIQLNDSVKIGSPVFFDKKRPDILFCSPASGKVSEIVYGPRRVIETVRITPSGEDYETHRGYRPDEIKGIQRDELIQSLLKGGVWPLIRRRPFDTIANPDETPSSIFVNCMDTAPLANDPEFSLKDKHAEFKAGLDALKILSGGAVHVVVSAERKGSIFTGHEGVSYHGFSGPHPAGLPSTHISLIDPVLKHGKIVWRLNARDAVRIGGFLLVGQLPADTVVALSGPGVQSPRYLSARAGARLGDLVGSDLAPGEQRIISGNILSGRKADPDSYLGFYDDLVSVLPEDREERFFGWTAPGLKRHSFTRTFLSSYIPGVRHVFNTNQNGEPRPLVKTGDYEKVVALDVLPEFLVKAILVEDIDLMEELGILECSPEDFALCSYVCPSKTEFTEIIQRGLDMIAREMN